MGIVKNEIEKIGNFIQNKTLHIPHFQRPYKWSVKNVIQLLDDIQRFKGTTPYRIGTIVIHEEDGVANIVDGQQRTVTFLLIIKAIMAYKYSLIKNNNLKEQLDIIKGNVFTPTFNSDISKKNIQDNYREIERRIVNFEEEWIDFFLNNCEITNFVIDDISEAFQFFDSQNARGKDLEPHDLLKAFHLRELDSSGNKISEEDKAKLVDAWENMDSKELSALFADFLYRVRGWSKGNSSRYFTKKDTGLFKGINLSRKDNFPYTQIYRLLDEHITESLGEGENVKFPFQLDQTIINGRYFFEMIAYYKQVNDQIKSNLSNLTPEAQQIINTLDRYEGKNRTGDKYVRMLFDCALLYYVDKFGRKDISKAIEKIFIWSYSLRLTYQSLQLASVDNYVVDTFNLFKIIKEAIYCDEILTLEIPLIREDFESDKTKEIKDLFIKMKYYSNAGQ
jgi:uncharacterized protein with ParB-like and HNH nuclease domain